MKWRCNVMAVLLCLLVLPFHARTALAAVSCDSLSSLSLSNAKITIAQTVAAGEFTPPAGRGRGAAPPGDVSGAAGAPAQAPAPAAATAPGRGGAGGRANFKD